MGLIKIVINEKELKDMVYKYIKSTLGKVNLKPDDIKIEVMSKQNFKSEWETAAFRAIVAKAL